ncbi:hypothetical protein Cenrod_1393 [Candidatus Symbiobacter mobilis CR]|uniref:Uncharacterized protein n=1 Tax=Candidatus Symbiobacter mobilis CR TaxID=946483 RepID=U5N844_9BURK|nr:hypothetical protein Cenrod_1393 [Candidatus Symbiobacter mobilis CR]
MFCLSAHSKKNQAVHAKNSGNLAGHFCGSIGVPNTTWHTLSSHMSSHLSWHMT